MADARIKLLSVFPNYDEPARLGIVICVLANMLIFPSVLMQILGVGGWVALAFNAFVVCYYVFMQVRSVGYFHVVLISVALLSTLWVALFWSSPLYFRYTVYLVSSLLILMIMSREDLIILIKIVSILFLVMLVLASFSFVAVFFGLEPLAIFHNRDGRPLYFFLTSFSNSYYGNIVRPSGIFDEPGALSFFVCGLACLRRLLNQSERVTWILLLLGLVTLSLAHVIYIFFYFISSFKVKKYLTLGPVVVSGMVFAIIVSGLGEVFYERLILRFEPSGDGIVAGDNRSERLMGGIEVLLGNESALVVGIGPDCIEDVHECKRELPPFSASPIEPVLIGGLLQSWPYYLVVIVLSASVLLGRSYFVVFGFALLLLQRPYVMHLGYSLYSLLIFLVVLGLIITFCQKIVSEPGQVDRRS